ncbi:Pol polyprotein [Cucumis melo var. makuwa]|uniref:Pol polyprotein n=1 Tax=Cucumis melo var. makuwa TaxID=1194695 RepID=A0A5A7VNQ0_CUCMM|nr:Pol polyprotein [Cucumis melo var. makuwa]
MTISLRIVVSSRIRGTKVEGDIDDVIDFEVSIYNLKQNIKEDEYDISPELLRLIEQEKKYYVISRDFEAIDYFTKWVEVASYKTVTKQAVVKFIRKDIICQYGLPERIITDNGKNLNNKLMEELCSQFKVKHYNSTPYRPKMNEAVETANKNIKKILEKMSVTYRDWHEMLPFALHGYRISVCTSTGATLYFTGVWFQSSFTY